ncbi:hypothetical protein OUZ56_013956 [Daphnia magna]|uniref:Uncharacterized protein n=1 Tax=Daphnia magna TaxID=35525 RepID=A0ABQ9Z846_9CRUS|nr:hypothetical protein OUZ56_013956 [Daphnia magna]
MDRRRKEQPQAFDVIPRMQLITTVGHSHTQATDIHRRETRVYVQLRARRQEESFYFLSCCPVWREMKPSRHLGSDDDIRSKEHISGRSNMLETFGDGTG